MVCRLLVVAALLSPPALGGEPKLVGMEVDGRKVKGTHQFLTAPQVAFVGLAVHEALLSDKTRCTIVTGAVISNVPARPIEVCVDFEIHLMRKGAVQPLSGCNVIGTIPRPRYGKETRFVMVGPAFRPLDGSASAVRPTNDARFAVLIKPTYRWQAYKFQGTVITDH